MSPLDHIRVVLVNPLYGGNVGSVCRAMANCGLRHLALVAPAPALDLEEARRMACNAGDLLAGRREFATFAEAVADCGIVAGTSVRPGLYRAHARSPREWAPTLLEAARAAPVALAFGREDNGLSNEDLTLCTHFIRIPSSPDYPSLNLAQAALICCHELYLAAGEFVPGSEKSPEAPSELRERMFALWEQTLLTVGFMEREKALHMMLGIRRIFARGLLTVDDVKILMGIARQMRWKIDRLPDPPPAGEAENPLPSILAHSLDVLYRRDLQQDRYDCVSPSVETLTGYSPAEFMQGGIGTTTGRIHPDDRSSAEAAIRAVLESPDGQGGAQYRYRRKDGVYRWFADRYRVLRDADGRPRYWLGTVRDITDLKEAEDRLRQSHRELESAVRERTRQLQELTVHLIGVEQRERERIGAILHEDLQQLLVAIRYAINHPSPPRVEELIDQALSVTRTLSGELLPPPRFQEPLARELAALADDLHRRLDLTVTLHCEPGVEWPPDHPVRLFLAHAAHEFLLNVTKHAGVRAATLSLRSAKTGTLLLEVRDQGLGGDPARGGQKGLGLARIRERALFFDGHLELESRPGAGFTARLILPRPA
jgi:tRNA/rRNA methyltransferase